MMQGKNKQIGLSDAQFGRAHCEKSCHCNSQGAEGHQSNRSGYRRKRIGLEITGNSQAVRCLYYTEIIRVDAPRSLFFAQVVPEACAGYALWVPAYEV